ncbi:MAG: N-formylglutamate amidohydrolase [Beijerinckiaceae bacterium]
MNAAEQTPCSVVAPAEQTLPFVFSSPHSGRNYPAAFLAQSRLDQHNLRRSEDCFVDILFQNAADLGAPLLKAHYPRAYLDANREPYELDPRMFDGRLPAFSNTRSIRVSGGLGTIPRIVGDGQEIYKNRLTVAEGLERIETIYRPYHRMLRDLVQTTHRRFGEAILFDCHSMPSASLGPELNPRPDFVLGDRYGTSCSPFLTEAVQSILESMGYNVARNRPYAGGFITEHYGNPASHVHALQIEINRALYMDEEALQPLPRFEQVQHDLVTVFDCLRHLLDRRLPAYGQAAE